MMKDIIDNGASFCHVDKIRAGSHAIDVITDGYHKWHGAIPIFISRENKRIISIVEVICDSIHIDILLKINSLDPSAWINKYFTDASVSWKLLDELMIGINEIKLSSIANQIINQFDLDKAIKVLTIRVDIDNI